MEDNKNNETEQVTEQVKAKCENHLLQKRKMPKDKEVVMVCEYN